jgi:hypothetical protein
MLSRAAASVAARSPPRALACLRSLVCYVGDGLLRPLARSFTMNRFLLPAAASIVIGLLLGAAAALGVTLQVGTHTPAPHSDNSASMLNRVEYGDRH